MSHNKDIERVARSMIAQKVEIEYVRHYLMETYQLDNKGIDAVFDRIGYAPKLAKGAKPPLKDGGGKPARQGFY